MSYFGPTGAFIQGTLISTGSSNLESGSSYKIGNVDVLTSTNLGSGVTGSSLTSVGTLQNLTVSGTARINDGLRLTKSGTTNFIQSGADTTTTGSAADFFIGNMLQIPSSSSRKFMIKADGKVGIQTDNPQDTLDVNGGIKFSTTISGPTGAFTTVNASNAIIGPTGSFTTLFATNHIGGSFTGGTGSFTTVNANNAIIGIGTTGLETQLTINGVTGSNILLNGYSYGNESAGLFFRSGFVNSSKYNCSIMNYDHNTTGGTPDGISINGFDGVSICTGANTRQERMRITQAGDVGIGVTGPNYKLDVNGTVGCSGDLTISKIAPRLNMNASSLSDISRIHFRDNTNTIQATLRYGLSNSTQPNRLAFFIGPDEVGGNAIFEARTDRYFIYKPLRTESNGQNQELVGTDHVYSAYFPRGIAAGRKGYLGFGSGNTTNMTLINEDTGLLQLGTNNTIVSQITSTRNMTVGYLAGVTGGIYLTQSGTYGKPSVQSVTNGFGADSLLLNPAGGNVGIGTTNPGSKFDIYANINSDLRSRIINASNESAAHGVLQFIRDGGVSGLVLFQNSSTRTSDGGVGTATIRNDSGSLRIQNDTWFVGSNVGIGTTNPAGKFEVYGDLTRLTNTNNSSDVLQLYRPGIRTWAIDINPTAGITEGNFRIIDKVTSGEFFTIRGNGNVGIGTNTPASSLDVRAGDIRVGANPGGEGNQWAPGTVRFGIDFFNQDLGSANTPGIVGSIKPYVHDSTGYSGLGIWNNTAPNTPVNFLTQAPTMLFRGSNVGIGTIGEPKGRLHVTGGVNSTILSWATGGGTSADVFNLNNHNRNWGIYVDNAIYAQDGFAHGSDVRIKEKIAEIHDGDSLNKLRLIEPAEYEYIDKLNKGNVKVFGFLAQQVRQFIPEAVGLIKDFIPNVYSRCTYNKEQRVITIEDGKAKNGILKIYTTKRQLCGHVKLIGPYNVEWPLDEIMEDELHNGTIFVYGYEVDDFHALKKDYLFTVNFAATQEIDRRQQTHHRQIEHLHVENDSLKETVKQLQEHNDELITQNISMKNRIEVLESQLSSLITKLILAGVIYEK